MLETVVNVLLAMPEREVWWHEGGNNPFGWYDPLNTIIPTDELSTYLREIIEWLPWNEIIRFIWSYEVHFSKNQNVYKSYAENEILRMLLFSFYTQLQRRHLIKGNSEERAW